MMDAATRRRVRFLTLVLGSLIVVLLGFYVPTGYILKAPGPVVDMSRVISVNDGRHEFPGKLLMVTAINQPATVFVYLYGLVLPGAELIRPEEEIYTVLPAPSIVPRNTRQSAAMAEVAAFRHLGYDARLGLYQEGGKTNMQAQRLPRNVRIDATSFEGTSAGLLMALETIRQFTGEDITGGQVVAGTGTLNALGQVGPIRGAAYKLQAARRAGATVFLVPEANYPEVRASSPPIRVIPVVTLEDALKALSNKKS